MSNKKSIKLKLLIAVLIVSLLPLMVGCGDGGVFLGGGSGEVRHVTERTIYLSMEKVRTLNPMISDDEDTYIISRLIYDGLFELDRYLMPQKRLVESYRYSDDGLTLTIDLRQGIQWHDGQELTAEDVRFSIENYINLAGSNQTIYASYVANIRAVNAVRGEPHRLTISFRSTSNTGLENLIFPILPAHQFRRGADIRRNIDEFIPIGTGPYQVLSYNHLSRLVLVPNPDYHGNVPQNQLEFIIFRDKRDALNLISINKVSLFISDELDRDAMTSTMHVNTVNFVSNRAEFVAFNMRHQTLGDRRVRQAIAYAIDSQQILETAYLNSGILSNTIYFPYFFGNTNEEKRYDFDLERAAELLYAAGLRDFDGTGFLQDRFGNEVRIGILVNADNAARMAAAEIIKNALDKLFFDSYIIYCDWDEYVSRINSGNFDMYIGGYSFNRRYDLRHLLHSQHNNRIGFSNPELDELLDEMQSGISNTRKAEVFQQVNAILKDEVPIYCILYKTYGAISSVSLRGEVDPLFHHFFNNSGGWVKVYERPAAMAE